MPSKTFRSHGKLLLFGEYAVIDGAKALAIPCKKGQTLQIKAHRGSDLIWESYDHNKELWFEAHFSLYDFSAIRTSDRATSDFLQKLLKGAVRQNTEFLNTWNGFKAINRLEFPRLWGLGTSSTLINNVANWAEVNPFHLHFAVSTGSGYDIACAEADGPLIYQLKDDELHFEEIDFDPSFMDQVFFVYLGNKQSTKSAISHYSKQAKKRRELAEEVSKLTEAAIACDDLTDFCDIVDAHEALLSKELNLKTVKSERFTDYNGSIKSMGAWGGDFAMAVSKGSVEADMAYFKTKGYATNIPYYDMLHATTLVKKMA